MMRAPPLRSDAMTGQQQQHQSMMERMERNGGGSSGGYLPSPRSSFSSASNASAGMMPPQQHRAASISPGSQRAASISPGSRMPATGQNYQQQQISPGSRNSFASAAGQNYSLQQQQQLSVARSLPLTSLMNARQSGSSANALAAANNNAPSSFVPQQKPPSSTVTKGYVITSTTIITTGITSRISTTTTTAAMGSATTHTTTAMSRPNQWPPQQIASTTNSNNKQMQTPISGQRKTNADTIFAILDSANGGQVTTAQHQPTVLGNTVTTVAVKSTQSALVPVERPSIVSSVAQQQQQQQQLQMTNSKVTGASPSGIAIQNAAKQSQQQQQQTQIPAAPKALTTSFEAKKNATEQPHNDGNTNEGNTIVKLASNFAGTDNKSVASIAGQDVVAHAQVIHSSSTTTAATAKMGVPPPPATREVLAASNGDREAMSTMVTKQQFQRENSSVVLQTAAEGCHQKLSITPATNRQFSENAGSATMSGDFMKSGAATIDPTKPIALPYGKIAAATPIPLPYATLSTTPSSPHAVTGNETTFGGSGTLMERGKTDEVHKVVEKTLFCSK